MLILFKFVAKVSVTAFPTEQSIEKILIIAKIV